MYLRSKLYVLLVTSLIALVSQSEDTENINLYIVPEGQPYVYIDDKGFFGEENFDKEREKWLKETDLTDVFSRPTTYPYPLSDKKCNIDIPMLITVPPFHVKLKEGICMVYCDKDDNNHCYSIMSMRLTSEEREIRRKKVEEWRRTLPSQNESAVLPRYPTLLE